jgi:hypothetical protein
MPIITDPTGGGAGIGTMCACSQAVAEPTCSLIEGPGIDITPGEPAIIAAESAAAWVTYSPTTVNFTLGNGTNASRYLLVGKTIDVIVAFKFGSTSTFGASNWRVGLPAGVAPFFDTLVISAGHSRGWASLYDDSAATQKYWQGQTFIQSGTSTPLGVRFGSASAGTNTEVNSTVPFPWATGDELLLRARFEVV